MADMTAFERQVQGHIHRFVGPVHPVDDLAIFDAVVAASRSQGWGFRMFSALKVVVAAAIVALFGGFLLITITPLPRSDEVAPAAVTDSPSPMTTEELLSGMVTEEVEPGVFRVINDGVRDLSSIDGWLIFAGHDGSVWLEVSGDLVRLGATQTRDPRVDEADALYDLEVAPDGTVWAAIMAEGRGDSLRSFDGEAWTTHPVVGRLEVTPGGRVWALADTISYLEADGAAWQTNEAPEFPNTGELRAFVATDSGVWVPQWNAVWHYADGVWDQIPYGDPDPGAMPDGVFWAIGEGPSGSHEILHRYDGTGWQRWTLEDEGMSPGWFAAPHKYATAPDGSFWAGWTVYVSDGAVDESRCGVSRFDGLTWTRYLPGMCVGRLDIAPDGSVWLAAAEGDGSEWDLPYSLYVITPEAVGASE
jgi:hypothetical protein